MFETIVGIAVVTILIFVVFWILMGRRFCNEANLSGLTRRLWLVDWGRSPRIQRRKLACNLSAGQTSFSPYGWFFALGIRRGDTISFCLEVHNTSGAPIPADELWAWDFIPPHLGYVRGTGITHVGDVETRISDERFNQQFEVRFNETGLTELPARASFTIRYRCRYGRIDAETQEDGDDGLPPVDWPAQEQNPAQEGGEDGPEPVIDFS